MVYLYMVIVWEDTSKMIWILELIRGRGRFGRNITRIIEQIVSLVVNSLGKKVIKINFEEEV